MTRRFERPEGARASPQGRAHDGRHRCRGHQAAPDRPRNLHPLQHLQIDLPGRRDHPQFAQLCGRREHLQSMHGLRAALPNRQHRQLARNAARAGLHYRGAARLGCFAGGTQRRGARRRGRFRGRARRGTHSAIGRCERRSRVRRQRLRRRHPALVRRQSLRQSLWAEGADPLGHGHCRRQCPGDRSRQGVRHPSHRARFRRDALPGARRPVDRNHAPRRRCGRASASSAPIFGRKPAQRRAARL